MKIEEFWKIIENAKNETPDVEAQIDCIIEVLLKKSVKDMIAYQNHFEAQMEKLSNVSIWLAGEYIMNITDETEMEERFPYFCAWIITLGKEALEAVVENTDNIASFIEKDGQTEEWICECEMMLYVADNAYEMKTGKEDFYEQFEAEPFFEIKGDFPDTTPDYVLMFPNISHKIR